MPIEMRKSILMNLLVSHWHKYGFGAEIHWYQLIVTMHLIVSLYLQRDQVINA